MLFEVKFEGGKRPRVHEQFTRIPFTVWTYAFWGYIWKRKKTQRVHEQFTKSPFTVWTDAFWGQVWGKKKTLQWDTNNWQESIRCLNRCLERLDLKEEKTQRVHKQFTRISFGVWIDQFWGPNLKEAIGAGYPLAAGDVCQSAISAHYSVGERGGERGKQVGSRNEESQVSGCKHNFYLLHQPGNIGAQATVHPKPRPASAGTLGERGRRGLSAQVLTLQIIRDIKLPPNQKKRKDDRGKKKKKKVKGSWPGAHTHVQYTPLHRIVRNTTKWTTKAPVWNTTKWTTKAPVWNTTKWTTKAPVWNTTKMDNQSSGVKHDKNGRPELRCETRAAADSRRDGQCGQLEADRLHSRHSGPFPRC